MDALVKIGLQCLESVIERGKGRTGIGGKPAAAGQLADVPKNTPA